MSIYSFSHSFTNRLGSLSLVSLLLLGALSGCSSQRQSDTSRSAPSKPVTSQGGGSNLNLNLKEQFFPLQSYRVGPYAAGGTGFFGGFIDYLNLINIRYPFRGGTSAQKPAPAMTLALFDGFTLTKKEFWLLRLGDFGPPEVVWALPVASPCWSDAIPTP
jgi:hypothetical protein